MTLERCCLGVRRDAFGRAGIGADLVATILRGRWKLHPKT
jgi:hypothetical protein